MGQGNHRTSRSGHTYETTKGHKAWREAVYVYAMQARRSKSGRTDGSIAGAVMLAAEFRFARPRSHLLKGGGLAKGAPLHKVSAPDLSKLLRCVEDSLTDAGVWADDSLVVGYGPCRKRWCKPGDEGATLWVQAVAE